MVGDMSEGERCPGCGAVLAFPVQSSGNCQWKCGTTRTAGEVDRSWACREITMWRRRTEEAEGQRSGLVGEIDRQRGRIAVLESALRAAEWSELRNGLPMCPVCKAFRYQEIHKEDCAIAAALAQQPATERAEGAQRPERDEYEGDPAESVIYPPLRGDIGRGPTWR